MKVLIINVIEFITFNMYPKLTDVILNCTVFVINVNITDFAGEKYIRTGRNTHQSYTDRNLVFKLVTVDYQVVVGDVLSLII